MGDLPDVDRPLEVTDCPPLPQVWMEVCDMPDHLPVFPANGGNQGQASLPFCGAHMGDLPDVGLSLVVTECPPLPQVCMEVCHLFDDTVLPADGGNHGRASLPFVSSPLHEDIGPSAGGLFSLPVLQSTGSEGGLPPVEIPLQLQQRSRRGKGRHRGSEYYPLTSRPHLRRNAIADVHRLGTMYGEDLNGLQPLAEWTDDNQSSITLRSRPWLHYDESGVLVPFDTIAGSPVFFLEIFAGCGCLTKTVAQHGLRVGPAIDKYTTTHPIDVLIAEDRKQVWALLTRCRPAWVHVAYPCTFWSNMAHWCRRRDAPSKDEAKRLEQLVFIAFARQIVHFQVTRGRHVSIENPMSSMSWKLDIVEDMIERGSLRAVETDFCYWGLTDPGNGLAYKKGVRLACSFDIAELGRRCSKNHEHQLIRGSVQQGTRQGEFRSKISGEYPHALCQAWATIATQATR